MKKRPKNIFVSFVEEGIQNPKYAGYVGGRVEVYGKRKDGYADEEVRFWSKRTRAWEDFRERWDFKDVTAGQLKYIKGKLTIFKKAYEV